MRDCENFHSVYVKYTRQQKEFSLQRTRDLFFSTNRNQTQSVCMLRFWQFIQYVCQIKTNPFSENWISNSSHLIASQRKLWVSDEFLISSSAVIGVLFVEKIYGKAGGTVQVEPQVIVTHYCIQAVDTTWQMPNFTGLKWKLSLGRFCKLNFHLSPLWKMQAKLLALVRDHGTTE